MHDFQLLLWLDRITFSFLTIPLNINQLKVRARQSVVWNDSDAEIALLNTAKFRLLDNSFGWSFAHTTRIRLHLDLPKIVRSHLNLVKPLLLVQKR